MITKVKRAAAGIIAALFIIGIVACSIVPITRDQPAPEIVEEVDAPATDEAEAVPAPPADFDIATGMKFKEKDGVKKLKTDHFTLTLSHGEQELNHDLQCRSE